NGLVPQEHLGPVRMRARAFSLLEEHQKRLELNGLAASDPKNILSAMTTRQSVFSKDDVERFILKHTPADKVPEVIEGFWKQEDLVQLRDKKSQAFVSVFTAKNVLEEERQMVRLADRIHAKPQLPIPERVQGEFAKNLSKEQTLAYKNILNGKGLSCIQGYAGVGKSYLLKALKDAYEEKGLIVRSFGPDNATANVLKEKGFSQSENLYRFLYSQKHGLRQVHKGFEVWILDEAGKVGNRPFLEFLKLAEAKGAKVILSGDHSQLPPVERGEAFKHFCTRYQTEVLEEIQRQKDGDSRAMAKDLATGKTGEALDKLSVKGAIKWSPTKKEAMEELILAWAKEHRGTSQEGQKNALETSLIIAQSNSEVRALNEMVRLVRKERGEISAREFRCEVVSGSQDKATLFVSEGDRIEFRKKDSDLGVKNGDVGVLLRAEEKKFVVALQENGKKVRMVGFDPKKYRGFQLGYASTAQRVQGRTVDRAFVLHSPYLNKQMAYVKLTRHVDQVSYFVSKEEATNLSDLKRQALRDGSKKATYDYTDTEAIEKQNALQRKESEIRSLKNEDKLIARFKGLTLQTWEHIKGKTSEYIEKKQDRMQSSEFFSFKDESASSKGNVQEVTHAQSIVLSEPSETISPQEVVEKIITQDYAIQKNSKLSSMSDSKKELTLMLNDKEGNRQDSSTSIDFSWKDLSKEEKKLIKGYYSAASKAQELREVVHAEGGEELKDVSTFPHYQQWQKVCAQRNAFAYLLKSFLSKSESKGVLKESSIYYIGVHAKRHEEVLKAREEQALKGEKLKNLEGSLASHIEPLLHKLFPDGPSVKTSQGYRFGAKGSLSVTCAGSKAGQFYDFERGEGGGLLTLIERELKMNRQEAKAWAGEFLGIAEEIKLPATFQKSHRSVETSDWISLKPNPKLPAPSFEKLGKLHHYYKEVARHPYHDLNGNLLYYVLRLENDKGEKITPPLSYGRYEGENPSWQLKGYTPEGEKRPLYNLHHLKEKPLAEVLIVEGEKTADRALEKFADERYVCLTWSGGAANVAKTDWSPLQGRKVKIWPDNDKAGFKAAADIVDEL
ncbi:MAG: AAA family ATPase, partial [Chlamydiia bacterium]|nr:AAA family ATPase [Chlamydiia bacterium]